MKTPHQRLIIILLAAMLGTVIGTSCNTFRGFGRDVRNTGHHIEHAAR